MSQKAISSLSQVFNRNSLFGEKLRSKAVCLCAWVKLDSWELLNDSLNQCLLYYHSRSPFWEIAAKTYGFNFEISIFTGSFIINGIFNDL